MAQASTQAGKYLNPNYQVHLRSKVGGEIDIIGFLPESLAINLSSNWDSILKSFIGSGQASGAGGSIVDKGLEKSQQLMQIFGAKTAYTKLSTFPTWTGTEPLEFSIPFRFDAVNDTEQDVVKPWVSLLKAVCPTEDGLTLRAPGPEVIIDEKTKLPVFKDDKTLVLRIGTFIFIEGVIITSVNNTMFSKFDIKGRPIQAQADVTLRTTFSPTVQDIENWFTGNVGYSQVDNMKAELTKFLDSPMAYVGGLAKDTLNSLGFGGL